MIVLDTNVISEIFRPRPDVRVVAWLESLTGDVAITAVTLAELLAGVRRLPDGRRKKALSAHIEVAVEPYRDDRPYLHSMTPRPRSTRTSSSRERRPGCRSARPTRRSRRYVECTMPYALPGISRISRIPASG